eukprot:m.76652 g.76652  ORF g.76652 m.76652 type:complete len:463 (+) comp9083_c0_seq2:2-1390(+)
MNLCLVRVDDVVSEMDFTEAPAIHRRRDTTETVSTNPPSTRMGLWRVLCFGLVGGLILDELQAASDGVRSTPNMRAVKVETPGAPDGMVIADMPVPETGATELLIRVQATAINRADTLQRKGSYNPPPGVTDILGLEAAGVVESVGVECTRGFKKGDSVMVLIAGGGYAEYVAVDERHVMSVPDGLTIVQAAAIPEVWLTAYQLLHFVGHVQAGETVLIHAGGSGVGTAATQLALLHGAKVIITAGGEAKRAHALELGASYAFARGEGWADEVKKATGGAGVNLVLDCVGASYWKQNAEALAMDGRSVVLGPPTLVHNNMLLDWLHRRSYPGLRVGLCCIYSEVGAHVHVWTRYRWVVYGLMGGAAIDGPILGSILRKRLTITGTTLRARHNDYKADLVAAFTKTALPLFSGASPKLRPIVDSVLPLERVVEAHTTMEANSNMGKIILLVDPAAGKVTRSDL